MHDRMLRAYLGASLAVSRLFTDERGDQNVGALGLIVVTMMIVGVLVKIFVPGVEEIITNVMTGMKEKLKVQ